MPSINLMIRDLEKLADEYSGHSALDDKELQGMDAFDRTKREIREGMNKLSPEIERLNDLRKAAPEGRSRDTIEIYAANTKALHVISSKWLLLKEWVKKEEKKGSKSKTEPELLATRKEAVVQLGKEIEALSQKNSHVKEVKKSDLQIKLEDKKKNRAKRQRKKRGEGGDDTKDDGKTDGGDDMSVDSADARSAGPVSVQEQKFMEEIQASREEEENILGDINKALDDLKEVAINIGQGLEEGKKIAEDVANNVEKLNEKFRTANQRLAEMIEENGGMSQWCTTIFCIVLLIALVGYILKITNSI